MLENNPSPVSLEVVSALLAAVGVYMIVRASNSRRGPSLPPGPPPDFLIGNLRHVPMSHMSDGFAALARTYGDIIHLTVLGRRMIVIHSYDVVQELLNKRPSTTAGRNMGYMYTHILGQGWGLENLQTGPKHTELRKMLRLAIGSQRVEHHDPMMEKGVIRLLLKLHGFKGDPSLILMSTVGRLITTISFGEEIWKDMGEELVGWNLEQMHYVNLAFAKFWPVDILHFLRFIPVWMPGAHFKKLGQRATWLSQQIRCKAFAKAVELYKLGQLGNSIAADLIEEFGATENAQDAVGILYLAGSEATSTAAISFCHALFLFPEVAQKVYEEIEAVTEGTRLPKVKDRGKMPYTEAVWKESFRWHPFLVFGIPHVNDADELINGFLIPKGSMLFANNGFMLMDPRIWGDPKTFRPERFLGPDADNLPNPLSMVFGYGLRACPGMYLADRLSFYYATTLAMLFSIVPLEGKGIPDPETVEYTDMVLNHPRGWECRFVPRSEKAKQLLGSLVLDD